MGFNVIYTVGFNEIEQNFMSFERSNIAAIWLV